MLVDVLEILDVLDVLDKLDALDVLEILESLDYLDYIESLMLVLTFQVVIALEQEVVVGEALGVNFACFVVK